MTPQTAISAVNKIISFCDAKRESKSALYTPTVNQLIDLYNLLGAAQDCVGDLLDYHPRRGASKDTDVIAATSSVVSEKAQVTSNSTPPVSDASTEKLLANLLAMMNQQQQAETNVVNSESTKESSVQKEETAHPTSTTSSSNDDEKSEERFTRVPKAYRGIPRAFKKCLNEVIAELDDRNIPQDDADYQVVRICQEWLNVRFNRRNDPYDKHKFQLRYMRNYVLAIVIAYNHAYEDGTVAEFNKEMHEFLDSVKRFNQKYTLPLSCARIFFKLNKGEYDVSQEYKSQLVWGMLWDTGLYRLVSDNMIPEDAMPDRDLAWAA